MTSTLWSVAILGIAIVGYLVLRALPERVRVTFDVISLAAVASILYRVGAPPFASSNVTSIDPWLRALSVAAWIFSARILVALLYFGQRHERSREGKLTVDLAAVGIYLTAALIILNSVLALPIGGLLATSGVLAIVLGLALQNTLSDVFSGIAVGIERPFQVGDRISLGNNMEGQVVDVNWRSIRIQTDGADIAVIPNSVVAKLEIVNRSVPTPNRSVSVELPCSAVSNPPRVIETLQQAVLLCSGVLQSPPPTVTLSRVGPDWNRYAISFSVANTQLVTATKSQLLRHACSQLRHAQLLRSSSEPTGPPGQRPMDARILPIPQILGELPLFECLQASEIDLLVAHTATRFLDAGETLFLQSAADATLYIVASGVLEVIQTTETGGARTLGTIGAGEYLGEIGLLTGAAHAATARTLTPCYVHQLSRSALEPLLAANHQLAGAFDQSVRRNLNLLHRSAAARASTELGSQSLLSRIRTFFASRGEGVS